VVAVVMGAVAVGIDPPPMGRTSMGLLV